MGEDQAGLVGSFLDDRYRVIRQIGRGAMGTVYEAQHALIGRRVAVKILRRSCASAAQRERFFHEARAAGAISHPNIVQVQDFGLAPSGQPYLVMEYVDGTDLQHHLQERGAFPLGEAIEICGQMLSALEVIHGAGLVHRDMKPANIMLARGGRGRPLTKLLDFGIARAINPGWQRPDLTRVDQVLGTPAYLSPEQSRGGSPDPRWDLWAMATILYEMLSGKLPFRLQNLDQVNEDIQSCRLVPLRERRADLPDWIYKIVDRAHHPDPDQRFRNATVFLQALEQQEAFPEGTESADGPGLRTFPFLRVKLLTPPPELIAELIGAGPGDVPGSREDSTRPELPAPRREAAAARKSPGSGERNRHRQGDPQPLQPRPTGPEPDQPRAGAAGRRVTGPVKPDPAAATWPDPEPARVEGSSEIPLRSRVARRTVARDAPEPARRYRAREAAHRRRRLVIFAVLLLLFSIVLLAYLFLT